MKAYVFGGMLVLSAALAACSSSEGDTGTGGGSGGGSGEGGGGDGGSGSVTSGTNTGSTGTNTPATTSTTTTSTGGGEGVCGTPLGTGDPATDACIDASCCTEFTACFGADGSNLDACNACLDAGGGALCDGFIACTSENCSGGGGVCDSGLSYVLEDGETPNDELNGCLGDACCDEYNACTQNGADVQACIDCFQGGGGPLCDPAEACANASGCLGYPICDAGVSVPDQAVAECMNANCCPEAEACFGLEGATFDECVACIEGGGGALCDDLIACDTTNACGLLTEG